MTTELCQPRALHLWGMALHALVRAHVGRLRSLLIVAAPAHTQSQLCRNHVVVMKTGTDMQILKVSGYSRLQVFDARRVKSDLEACWSYNL